MRGVLLAMLVQLVESPGNDELVRIRGLRAEDPANGRLAFVEGQLALDAGRLSEAMSAFTDAVELLERPGDLARAHHAVAVTQHQTALSQVVQNPSLAQQMIASAIANYAQALEFDPKLEPARRNGERATQFASSVPPPPPESSGGGNVNQDGSSDSADAPASDAPASDAPASDAPASDAPPSDATRSSDQLKPSDGESVDQDQVAQSQSSPSPSESIFDPSSGLVQSLSKEEVRRMLQEIRDRADELQEALSARQSRPRVVERDW